MTASGRKYGILASVFFGIVAGLSIVGMLLDYWGILTPLEAGVAEPAVAYAYMGRSMMRSPLFWANLVIFTLAFIGVVSKKNSLTFLSALLGIVICVLNLSGLLVGLLYATQILSIGQSGFFSLFTSGISLFYRGLSRSFKLSNSANLLYVNNVFFLLYFIAVAVISKQKTESGFWGIGGLLSALLLTAFRLGWLFHAYAGGRRGVYGILSLLLLSTLGICLGLAPFFYNKSRGQAVPVVQKDAGGSSPSSVVDKLFALKELLDRGIITREEFDEKKKQIMGL